MNKVYKTVWNESTGTFIAVPENTASKGKKSSSQRTAGATVGNGLAKLSLIAMATGASLLSFSAQAGYTNLGGSTASAYGIAIGNGISHTYDNTNYIHPKPIAPPLCIYVYGYYQNLYQVLGPECQMPFPMYALDCHQR